MKFILINLDNGFSNQNSHVLVFIFSGVVVHTEVHHLWSITRKQSIDRSM